MKVRDLMTTDVVTVHPRSTFKHTVERMLARGVSGLPVVVDDARLVGIVTEADLISKEAFDEPRRPVEAVLGLLTGDRRWTGKASGVAAGDIMTTEVATIGPDDDLRAAARLMLREGVKRLPVVEDGRLVGIISRHDLLGVFHREDTDIAHDVEERLRHSRAVPPDSVSVVVFSGIVTLHGSVRGEDDRAPVVALAAQVPGVVAVKDCLTLIP